MSFIIWKKWHFSIFIMSMQDSTIGIIAWLQNIGQKEDTHESKPIVGAGNQSKPLRYRQRLRILCL